MKGSGVAGLALWLLSLLVPSTMARADWSEYQLDQRCNKLSDTFFRSDASDWPKARIAEANSYCRGSLAGLLLLAQIHIASGEYEEGRQQLQLVDKLPGADRSGRYRFWRGYLFARDKDYLHSLVEFRRAQTQGGVDAWLIDYNTADVLMAAGRLDEAISAYRRAARAKPDHRSVMLGLAVALDRAGDLEGAQKIFSQTLRGERHLDRVWPRGLVLFPAEEEHVYRGLLLAHLGRNKEACEELGRFLAVAPNSPWAAHATERLNTFALAVDQSK